MQKSVQLFLTAGKEYAVDLWSIWPPTPDGSTCYHTSTCYSSPTGRPELYNFKKTKLGL